jgi:hypothetical protein
VENLRLSLQDENEMILQEPYHSAVILLSSLPPEKTRRNPRSGFMVQELTLFRIG